MLPHHFTSTYAKNLLADWALISELISKKTAWIKETIQQTDDEQKNTRLLSERQLNDALNGPFQAFFKMHLNAYMQMTKLETALTIAKEEFFKDSEHPVDITFGIPESILTTTDLSSLKESREQLNQLTQKHHTELETTVQAWVQELLAAFEPNNVPLSKIEIEDFTANQPISELQDRFLNLKVTLPSLKKTDLDFQQYFRLKITLAIHSALHRMQLPNTDKDIEQALKTFQPILKTVGKAEEKLMAEQKTALFANH